MADHKLKEWLDTIPEAIIFFAVGALVGIAINDYRQQLQNKMNESKNPTHTVRPIDSEEPVVPYDGANY